MAKCSRCRKSDSVIDVKYINQSLCSDCFTHFFERRVRRTIRRNELLGPSETMSVALSGGTDSMVVLTIFKSLSKKDPKSKLFAIMIDEGAPGCRDEAIKVAKKYCKELGVDCHVYSFKEELGMTISEMIKKAGKGLQPCVYCSAFRRQLLGEKAHELGTTKLITGHNLDDECEDALVGLMGGRLHPIERSGAMDKSPAVPLIRPLRECPEDEIALYAKLNKIPAVTCKCPYEQGELTPAVGKMRAELVKRYSGVNYQILAGVDELAGLIKDKELSKVCKKCREPLAGNMCPICKVRKELDLNY